MEKSATTWDTQYEWKAVLLLSIGFGLVGLDRWIIAPLFPFMMRDLNMNYGEIGALAGALAIAWGLASFPMGRLSDRLGHRAVLIPSLLLFSALAGLSGAAAGFTSLLLIRIIIGVTEGTFSPACFACTTQASKFSRRGLNLGLTASLYALLGFGLGPIIATQLLKIVPSWRYVFLLVSVPGFILCAFMYFVIRKQARPQISVVHEREAEKSGNWKDVFKNRNILVAMCGVLCAMCCNFVIGAMMPSYLIDYLKLRPDQMGLVLSAIGFGGFFGEFCVPGLSDLIGRKVTAIAIFIVGAVFLKIFEAVGADPMLLFVLLFCVGFCCMGLTILFVGPIATEAVSPMLLATAVGVVSGTGEIFGGGVAPAIGGWIAQTYGIQHILDWALAGMLCGIVVSFFLKESAPRRVAAAAKRALGEVPVGAGE